MNESYPGITVIYPEDEDGELILQFSPEFMAQRGWEVGDKFSFRTDGSTAVMTHIPKRNRRQKKKMQKRLATAAERLSSHSTVLCTLCGDPANKVEHGVPAGSLESHTDLQGRRYKVDLCEGCFAQTLAYLRQERRIKVMFRDDEEEAASYSSDVFGIVST